MHACNTNVYQSEKKVLRIHSRIKGGSTLQLLVIAESQSQRIQPTFLAYCLKTDKINCMFKLFTHDFSLRKLLWAMIPHGQHPILRKLAPKHTCRGGEWKQPRFIVFIWEQACSWRGIGLLFQDVAPTKHLFHLVVPLKVGAVESSSKCGFVVSEREFVAFFAG